MAKKQKSPVVEEEEEPTPPLDLAAARLVKTKHSIGKLLLAQPTLSTLMLPLAHVWSRRIFQHNLA